MSTIESNGVSLHVSDSGGDGRPVVLIHGWPQSGEAWAPQVPALTSAGYRVVTYDRRGFGDSTAAGPYDYDTFAADLDAVMTGLDLRDATILGFSMGGGEIARYLGEYGSDRVRSAVLAAAIPPWLLKSDENPDGGFPRDAAVGMQEQLLADREGMLDGFMTGYFSAGGELAVTEAQRQAALALAAKADTEAAAACILAWLEDFTGDLEKIDVPVLVIHGDSDGIVPLEVSGARSAQLVSDGTLVVIAGGPHGINVSHTDEFNAALIDFLER